MNRKLVTKNKTRFHWWNVKYNIKRQWDWMYHIIFSLYNYPMKLGQCIFYFILFYWSAFFFVVVVATTRGHSDYFWLCTKGSFLVVFRGLYEVPGIEYRSASYKARICPMYYFSNPYYIYLRGMETETLIICIEQGFLNLFTCDPLFTWEKFFQVQGIRGNIDRLNHKGI